MGTDHAPMRMALEAGVEAGGLLAADDGGVITTRAGGEQAAELTPRVTVPDDVMASFVRYIGTRRVPDWFSPTRAAEFVARWMNGERTKAIGDAFGVSKNAIIGFVHRAELPVRASPIKYADGAAPAREKPPRLPPSTLPPLPSEAPLQGMTIVPVVIPPPPTSIAKPRPLSPPVTRTGDPPTPRAFRPPPVVSAAVFRAPNPRVAPPAPIPPATIVTRGTCQFPQWNGAAPSPPRFCDAPAVANYSWCERHCRVVFVGWRNARAPFPELSVAP